MMMMMIMIIVILLLLQIIIGNNNNIAYACFRHSSKLKLIICVFAKTSCDKLFRVFTLNGSQAKNKDKLIIVLWCPCQILWYDGQIGNDILKIWQPLTKPAMKFSPILVPLLLVCLVHLDNDHDDDKLGAKWAVIDHLSLLLIFFHLSPWQKMHEANTRTLCFVCLPLPPYRTNIRTHTHTVSLIRTFIWDTKASSTDFRRCKLVRFMWNKFGILWKLISMAVDESDRYVYTNESTVSKCSIWFLLHLPISCSYLWLMPSSVGSPP